MNQNPWEEKLEKELPRDARNEFTHDWLKEFIGELIEDERNRLRREIEERKHHHDCGKVNCGGKYNQALDYVIHLLKP